MKRAAGLYELRVTLAPAIADAVSAQLFAAGAGGVEERAAGPDTLLLLYAPSQSEARALARAAQSALASLRSEHARTARVEVVPSTAVGWETEWTRWLRPESITKRIVLQPASLERPAPRGKRRLLFAPDLVFGVGSHPTTRLAAQAVERFCLAHPRANVLDVGTGTGVLAMVAAVTGARSVLGLDDDPRAVRSAQKNAAQNGLAEVCRFSRRALARERGAFDLVVANLELPILEALAPDLVRRVGTDGRLVVTGLLATRAAALAEQFAAAGLEVRAKRLNGEWALLELGWAKPAKVATKAAPHDGGQEQRGRGRGSRRAGRGARARGRARRRARA